MSEDQHVPKFTYSFPYDEWIYYCSCGNTGSYLTSRGAAENEHARHVAEKASEEASHGRPD